MPEWDLLITDARIATMRSGAAPYGTLERGALAIRDGAIAWLGPMSELPSAHDATVRSLEGRWLTPALIDCHTHLVFAGNRAEEFAMYRTSLNFIDGVIGQVLDDLGERGLLDNTVVLISADHGGSNSERAVNTARRRGPDSAPMS